jgi:hypothetical protein
MNLGAMIEVAIGIIFVWIVLSLTTIQIQEWITSQLNRRSKDLEAAIHEMLANPNLKDQFYDHPVIRGLSARNRKEPSRIPPWFYRFPLLRGFTKEKRRLPSYIPSQQFAIALFDIALTANTESSLIQQGIFKLRDDLQKDRQMTGREAVIEELNLLAEFARSAAATEAGTAITLRTREILQEKTDHFIEYFNEHHKDIKLDPKVVDMIKVGMARAREEAKKLKDDMDKVVAAQTAGMDKALEAAKKFKGDMDKVVAAQAEDTDTTLTKIRRGVAALSVISPEAHQTLNALLMNVEEYAGEKEKLLAKARGNVETWYDDSMDRVSGVFKRYSQRMALIIGFIVALVLNVDSVNLTLYLWREPSVRQVLVTQASNFELSSEATGNGTNPSESTRTAMQQLKELNLPVGWGASDFTAGSCSLFPGEKQTFGVPLPFLNKCLTTPNTDDQTNLLIKLGGIFITALAAMQGAPFWFDMLKRVVNIRSTGPNPAEKK